MAGGTAAVTPVFDFLFPTALGVALWTIAGLLVVVALTGGVTKVFVPKEKLAAAPGGGWTGDASVGFVRTLGVLELLAALRGGAQAIGLLTGGAGTSAPVSAFTPSS